MLRLTYRGETTVPVEAECIAPDKLAGKSLAEIAALPLFHGNRPATVGDFFTAEGDSADADVVLTGDCSRVKLLGAGMAGGRLVIESDAGMHVGAEMTGGELIVRGNVGDWVGAELHGGRIHVHGNAGHLAGAGYRGSRRGMRGGVLLIDGNAGNEVGGTMRRGVIAIGGDVGDFVGCGMIAGTILVGGQPGIRVAPGMKRGSVILFGPMPPMLPSFRYACSYRPSFVPLYLRQLRAWGFAPAERWTAAEFRRYSGDLVALGKGEILHALSAQ